MRAAAYRGARFTAANDETGLLEGEAVVRSPYSDSPGRREEASCSPMASADAGGVSRGYSRYCDQPMDWRTRLFGFAGTSAIAALIAAAALFTWKAVYQPVRTTSQALTVVDLAPLAAPPQPVREVAPGPEQAEKQEAKPDRTREVLPVPLVQFPINASVNADEQRPVEMVEPGPSVPETRAPKSIAAPAANRLASDAKANWEDLILAHLERFRRYPARARAARQQGGVRIRFRMNRVGRVLSSTIVSKSGSFDLDRAALDTLQRSQPLPAIPAGMPDEVELTVPVEFYLN